MHSANDMCDSVSHSFKDAAANIAKRGCLSKRQPTQGEFQTINGEEAQMGFTNKSEMTHPFHEILDLSLQHFSFL